jgi:hypothetical protein
VFGLSDTRIVIRTDSAGRRQVQVKAPILGRRTPDPLAGKVAGFARDLPRAAAPDLRGTVRLRRGRRSAVFGAGRRSVLRLVFSRGFDPRLAQRIRNYVASLM